MNNKTKNHFLIGLASLLGMIGQSVGPLASTASAAVVPMETYGSNYGELSARWWQWLLSIPAAINPNLDSTGVNCGQGQYDDVTFLAGSFNGNVVRDSCTIPAGKPIFFPLINVVAFDPTPKETLMSLRMQAADAMDQVSELHCTIDGVACSDNLFKFRVRSPSFSFIAPQKGIMAPNWLTMPGNADQLVSDGFWILLDSLTPGDHIINFGGTADTFSLDLTYNLKVE